MSFAENLKKARVKSNYSRKDMARFLGITIPAYANYENGEREPKQAALAIICKKLNISAEDLLDIHVKSDHDLLSMAAVYMQASGYPYQIDSPVDLLGLDKYAFYFVKSLDDEDEGYYDIVPFEKDLLLDFGADLEADNTDNIYNYVLNFQNRSLNYICWLADTSRLSTVYKKVFPLIYDQNEEKAEAYLYAQDNFRPAPNENRAAMGIPPRAAMGIPPRAAMGIPPRAAMGIPPRTVIRKTAAASLNEFPSDLKYNLLLYDLRALKKELTARYGYQYNICESLGESMVAEAAFPGTKKG